MYFYVFHMKVYTFLNQFKTIQGIQHQISELASYVVKFSYCKLTY